MNIFTDMDNMSTVNRFKLTLGIHRELREWKVAQAIGISHPQLSHILNGRREASPEILAKMERWLARNAIRYPITLPQQEPQP